MYAWTRKKWLYFGSHPLSDLRIFEGFFNIATYGIFRSLTHWKTGPDLRENFAVDNSLDYRHGPPQAWARGGTCSLWKCCNFFVHK